jgi:CxxC motif-containing protein (DUF1111 family)
MMSRRAASVFEYNLGLSTRMSAKRNADATWNELTCLRIPRSNRLGVRQSLQESRTVMSTATTRRAGLLDRTKLLQNFSKIG